MYEHIEQAKEIEKEQIEMHKRGQYLMNVAEARQYDMAAEKYFQQEVERFIKAMLVK
jgi:hypothetical protein